MSDHHVREKNVCDPVAAVTDNGAAQGAIGASQYFTLGGKQFALDVFVLARGGLEHDVGPERRVRERTSTIG